MKSAKTRRIRKDTPLFGVPGDLGRAIGFALRKLYFIQGNKRGKQSGLTVYDASLKTPCASVIEGSWVILNEEWALKEAPRTLIDLAKKTLPEDHPPSLVQIAISESWVKYQKHLRKIPKSV